ncbi:TPA: hypothetical protein L6776_002718, partial [Escherichia coli]|nr:hypothetical protein [Escherichia coli]
GTVQAEYDIKSSDTKVVEYISQKILSEIHDKDYSKNILLAALAKVSIAIVNDKDD